MTKLSWRSRFWNAVLTVLMAFFFLMTMAIAIDQLSRPQPERKFWAAFFAAWSIYFLVSTIRASFVGVSATKKGISIRSPLLSKHIPWSEVSDIRIGNLSSGVAGTIGAQAPIVYRETAENPKKPVVVKELGSYPTGEGDSLAEKSTNELREYFQRVRAHQ